MSDPSPDLAVVVVDYNAGEHLSRCVASVLAAASGVRVELVVVDNASVDGSARRVASQHAQVTLIENPRNVGFASAANRGIEATSAPWVFVVNPDAEIARGTFRELLALAGARPRAGAIGTLVRDPDGTLYPSARRIPTPSEAVGHALIGPFVPENRFSRAYTMGGWDRMSEREVDWVSGSCVLIRREAIDRLGAAFDPAYFMYAEDADLCTRLRVAGWSILFTPSMEVVHDRGLSTRGSRRMIWEHSRSIYRYVGKHYARGWRRSLLPLAKGVLWLRAAIVSRRMWRP